MTFLHISVFKYELLLMYYLNSLFFEEQLNFFSNHSKCLDLILNTKENIYIPHQNLISNEFRLNENEYLIQNDPKIKSILKNLTDDSILDFIINKNHSCFIIHLLYENNERKLEESVCGNGKKEGQEECDDGNIKNGDGCSSECKIEQFYDCSKTSETGASLCFNRIPPYYIISQLNNLEINAKYISLALTFSKKMKTIDLKKSLIISAPEIKVGTDFDWNYEIRNDNIYVVNITFFLSFQLKIINFELVDPKNIKDINDISLAQISYNTEYLLDEFIFYSTKDYETFEIIFDFLNYFMLGMLFSFFPLFLIESLSVFWLYIEMLQLLNLLTFVNVNLPLNGIIFFKALSAANFMKKEYSSSIIPKEFINGKNAPTEFYEEGIYSGFITNAFFALVFMGTIIFIYLLVKLCTYIFVIRMENQKCCSCFLNMIITIERYLEYSSLLRACIVTYTPFFLASVLQLQNIEFNNWTSSLQSSMSIICIIYLGLFAIFTIYFLNNNNINLEDPEIMYKFNPLFDLLKKNAFFKKNFTTFFIIRKILWIIALVFLESNSLEQLFLMIFSSMFIVTFMLFKNPYLDERINRMKLFSEFMILVILLLIAGIDCFDYLELKGNGMSISNKIIICWVIVSIGFLLLLIKLIFIFIEIFSNLKKLIYNTNNLIQNLNKKEIIKLSGDADNLIEMGRLSNNGDVDIIKEEEEEEDIDESAKRIKF